METLVKEEGTIAPPTSYGREAVEALAASRQEPDWLLDKRLLAWRFFEEIPWPTYNEETWRRTRLTGFKLDNYRPLAPVPAQVSGAAALPEHLRRELNEMESAAALLHQDSGVLYREAGDLASKGVIFTDLATAVREHPELVQKYFMNSVAIDENKFTALHAALCNAGTFVYVPRNVVIDLPLQVITNLATEGVGSFYHNIIVTESGAAVTLVDDFLGGRQTLQSSVIELYVGPNSQVRYMNLQDYDKTTWNFSTGRAVLQRDSDLRWIQCSWGSRLSKVWIHLDLVEPGTRGELLGLYFTSGNQHIDHHTLQNHIAPHATSDLLFKGALRDRSRSVYQGSIKVHKDAQKTDAYQSNQNLILDKRARADSIPGLEIEANDVRCTHGATAAQVEKEYLFYLMTRGLDKSTAERLIVQGFFEEVLNRVPVAEVREKLERVIARKIGFGE